MPAPRTIFDKIWDRHLIEARQDGNDLLYIDRLLVQENVFHAFDNLRRSGRRVRCPEQIFAFTDHYVPTRDRDAGIADPEIRNMVETMQRNATEHGIALFGLGDVRQGILHVVPPEQGITQPGLIVAGADSHSSTHGALGAFGFGVGVSEATHILATQTLWRRRPRTMRIEVSGRIPLGVAAKDIVLHIVGRIGADGGVGHVIEYTGPAIRSLSVEGRMTVCNMSIEAGARAGLVSPDDATVDYIEGRPYAPRGEDWDRAVAWWRGIATDEDAEFDREVALDADRIAPMVTWGTSPEDVLPITGAVPDPAREADPERRDRIARALAYMDLVPGTPLAQIALDRVFIGSCTNSRIEDLRAVAQVVEGRRAAIPSMIVPGSGLVKLQAEREGLDRIFRDAGFEWRDAGCSMCVATNGDMLQPGERCASTSNRNFEGRQGRGGRSHLVSPAMAAAAAIAGRLTDVRALDRQG